jgi:hypothetical protein
LTISSLEDDTSSRSGKTVTPSASKEKRRAAWEWSEKFDYDARTLSLCRGLGRSRWKYWEMHRRRCGTQHLSEHRVECAKLRELGCVRPLRTFALDAVLLLYRRHMLVRVQDRVRKPDMLRE